MRILVSRTGGFAGLEEDLAAVDTAELDPDEGSALERLVHEANFFALPSTLPDAGIGADYFQYAVTAIDGGEQHTVSYRDAGDGTRREATGDIYAMSRIVDAALRA